VVAADLRDASALEARPLRACSWCELSIAAAARRDAKFCSKRCRQASHRFHRPSRRAGAAQPVARGLSRRFAYADPPYPGLARKYYAGHVDYAGEIDVSALIRRLCSFDGWALSTSAAALPLVLASCPAGVRIAAWVRGERPTASYAPLSSWEPVIYWGGRRYLSTGSARRLDSLIHFARPRLTDRRRVVGAKPAEFCAWLFKLLGATAGDELVDLFPGSGGVQRAWSAFQASCADPVATRSPNDGSRPGAGDGWPPGWRDGSARGLRDASAVATGDTSHEQAAAAGDA
jgi:hypothetical protein